MADVSKGMVMLDYDARNIDNRVLLVIRALAEYMICACYLAYGETLQCELPPDRGDLFCYEWMKSRNWCESEVQMLWQLISSSELYYMSHFERPHPEKSHGECTPFQCMAYQIDENTYSTAHIDSDCDCELVFACQEELDNVLRGKSGHGPSIPIVALNTLERSTDSKLYVKIRSTAVEQEYVAISHVWSDRLGTQVDNAIPRCQYERLCQLVLQFSSHDEQTSLCFWLDTLCFPLRPKEAYDQALIKMADSYELAKAILVLDKYLLKETAEGTSRNEILCRVVCSPWSRRLWIF